MADSPQAQANRLVARGRAALWREDENEALDLFTRALAADPENLNARYLSALCAHLLTREELLEEVCAGALEINRHHPYTLACEAVRYLYLANFSRAEGLFEQALRALPDVLELHIGIGILYEYSGDTQKGTAAYRRALQIDPDNVRVHTALGGFLSTDGEFDAAFAEYSRAHAVEPTAENPHQRLGRDYYHEGMIEQSAGEFAAAADEDPGEPAAYFYLLDCMRRLDRPDDAIDVYKDILHRFGNDPELTSGFYEYFNFRAEAINALELLAKNKPDDPGFLARLSRAYRDAGRVPDATATAEHLVRIAPEDSDALTLLADLHFKREDYSSVLTLCRRAIKLNPNAQRAYTILADTLLFLGRLDESSSTIQEMERVRRAAWERYQARFSGQDRADADAS
jgi:tetratricopeptide (TPR) repeat protein